MTKLYSHQLEALDKMKNGCILCGDVGSGKSITAISYYYLKFGGSREFLEGGEYEPMDDILIKDIYIITTARKRDTNEWGLELAPFLIGQDDMYAHAVTIDSWNNIAKYKDVFGAVFIFDEQRLVGNGAWVKSFYKIAKNNEWILLSATPGDTWLDYIPVFIANGFYHSRTDFHDQHVIFERFSKFPKVKGYYNEGKLIRLRNDILIDMKDQRTTTQHHIDIWCGFDKEKYLNVYKDRWNPWDEEPIKNAGQWCYLQRKVVNESDERQMEFHRLLEDHERAIVFYNFDYELDLIRSILPPGLAYGEWNGHRHGSIPDCDEWVFLVQYSAGCEGWNCTSTDTIIFWSQNYSYRVMKQASGRIDRINTPYKDLYYYHLKSRSAIDRQISLALSRKKTFNARAFAGGRF